MFLGFLVSGVLWSRSVETAGLLVGATLVFGVGLWDDLRRMPPYTKLIAQLLVGCVVVFSGIRIALPDWTWLTIPLSVMWLVLAMNAFNLLDNMDGLAAGVGAIAAGFCAIHAALAQQWVVVALDATLVGTCLGFLSSNFPPAKIYMGDSGSHLIGLSLAALALMGTWRHSTQLLSVLAVPTLVLAVPIFDTCFVTVQRLAHRLHPFVGGRDHVSHRLAVLGLSTRQTVLALYGMSASLGLVSVVTAKLAAPATLALWVLVVTALALFGSYLGRVKVYRLADPETPAGMCDATPSTLIETMLLHKRRLLEVVLDFSLLSCAYVLAYLLRFEGVLTDELQELIIRSLPVLLVLKLSCFAGFGLYRGLWQYAGLPDLLAVFKAAVLGSVLSAVALVYLWRFEGYSRAVFVIDWMLTLLMVGGARVAERLLDEWVNRVAGRGRPAVIVGAGDTGVRVLRSLRDEETCRYRVVGFLDDDPRKSRGRIQGIPVLGSRAELASVLEAHHVQDVLIAIADPSGELLQDVQRCCEPRGVGWRIVTADVTSAA